MLSHVARRIVPIMVLVAVCCLSADARVILKPKGSDAMPVWTRSLSADVRIDGQIAATTMVMTFQNESENQIEADFICTLPPGATYFAYWAGDEKVVARVVEKKRAAEIYRKITEVRRDPALVEMTGKNTFRARISPVLPNADLKVEIRIAQAMPSDANGTVYNLQLPYDQLDPLDKIDVRIEVKADDGIKSVATNYGLPVKEEQGSYRIAVSGENYRPPRDLNVRITHKTAPLRAALVAAPAGGPDGFFALTLIPDRTISKPSVLIQGVATYDVVTPPVGRLKALQTFVVFGRYKGSGKATVTLRGKSVAGAYVQSQSVDFGSAADPDNPASRLWAAARISQLSAKPSDRSRVVEMSKRFGLPSKYTSWLAVPKEEMVRHKREQMWDKLDHVARRLAELTINGTAESDEGVKLRKSLDEMCSQIGCKPEDEMAQYIRDATYSLGYRFVETVASGKATNAEEERMKALFVDWAGKNGIKPEEYLREQFRYAMDRAVHDFATAKYALNPSPISVDYAQKKMQRLEEASGIPAETMIAAEEKEQRMYGAAMALSLLITLIAEGKDRTPEAEAMRKRFEELSDASESQRREQLQCQMTWQMEQLVRQLSWDKKETKRIGAEQRIKRLEAATGVSSKAYRRQWAERIQSRSYDDLRYSLVDLVVHGKGHTKDASKLKQRFREACRKAGIDPDSELQKALLQGLHWRLAWLWQDREALRSDPAEAKRLNQEAKRLLAITGVSGQEVLRRVKEYELADEAELSRTRIEAELERPKPNAARLTRLRKEFKTNLGQAVSAAPKSWDPGLPDEYDAVMQEVIDIQLAAPRQDGQPAPLPTALRRRKDAVEAKFAGRYYTLRAIMRPGDPLISVEAPADALQVVALMPDGEVKTLQFNAETQRWEARFDIPGYAPEGDYVVTIVVVLKDETRKTLTLRYRVDTTPPRGQASAKSVESPGLKLRLEVIAEEDTVRVVALLPWGERVELKRGSEANTFFAVVAAPENDESTIGAVTFILTDSAHNRTTVTVDTAAN